MGKRLTRQQRAKKLRLDHCGVTGKVRYRTEGCAREGLRMLKGRKKSDPEREERRAYKCWSCAGWHLTKQAYGAPRGDVARLLPPPPKEGKATA